MRVPGCRECERLWEKYTDAMFDFGKINRESRLAQLRRNSPEISALLRKGVEAAAYWRDAALTRLRQHEATHQMRSAAAS